MLSLCMYTEHDCLDFGNCWIISLLFLSEEGLDYEAITLSIIIPAGSANGSLTCCDTVVTILDDDIVEYSERFGIVLVSSDPVLYIGDPNSEPVVIVDDDSKYSSLVRYFSFHVYLYPNEQSETLEKTL